MRRAGRILSRLSGVGSPSGTFDRTLRAALAFALAAWALEAAFALSGGLLLTPARARGLLAGLGLSCLSAVVVALVLALVLWLTRRAGQPAGGDGAGVRTRIARFLFERNAEAQRGRVGGLLGALGLLAMFCGAAFAVTHALVLGMARPHFAAIAIVASHLALMAALAASFPVARKLGIATAGGLARIPGASWVVSRAGVLLGCVLFGALAAAAGLLVAYWQTFAFLPWSTIATCSGASLFALVTIGLAPRLGAPALVLGRALRAALVIASLLALATLDARSEESRRAVHETWNGKLGQRAALVLLDFDRDGSLHVFGGGDCAPFDPRVGPLMVDVPDNGRDEDCDGTDLDAERLGIELRRDFAVPESFPKRPPIVLVTIDAFASKRLQAFGYAREVTPRLDAFAARSVLFRYAFSQGPSTRLSFPSMFTSRWDSQIEQILVGSHPYPIGESELMLAELLAQHGYDTLAVIPDAYFKKSRWGSLTAGFRRVIDSPLRKRGRHNSAAVTDAALAELAKKREKPLFLWVHYYDAHSPHVQPKGEPAFGRSREDVYDAELRLVDREVGRLLDALERELPEPPLIIVTADHGIAFDAPRHVKFNYGYDLSTVVLHVPLIIRGPGIAPAVLDGIVSTMDIAPTIANLLRIRRKLPFEGASLLPELFEGQGQRPDRLMHQFYLEERLWKDEDPLEQVSLRTDRYNLIHNRKTGTFELYDWRSDYYEARNLADEGEHRVAFEGLKQQLALLTYRVYGRERVRAENLTRVAKP